MIDKQLQQDIAHQSGSDIAKSSWVRVGLLLLACFVGAAAGKALVAMMARAL